MRDYSDNADIAQTYFDSECELEVKVGGMESTPDLLSLIENAQDELTQSILDYLENNLTLEIVEFYGEFWDLVASEGELSRLFDEMVEECIASGSTVDLDDSAMLAEWFNNWTDSLCSDSDIHPIQYDQYTYTGKYF